MIRENVPTSPLISIRIGGPARFFAQPKTLPEIIEALEQADRQSLPVKIIGGGSNLVMADDGFGGILIQPSLRALRLLEKEEYGQYQEALAQLKKSGTEARYRTEGGENFLHLEDRGPEIGLQEPVLVEMDAAVAWGQAVMWSLQRKLAGLHWFARIPCQVGGATYNNIHAERHFLSEFICAVRVIDRATKEERFITAGDLEFGYDYSRFHREPAIITSVIMALQPVSAEEAKTCQAQYLEWTAQKNTIQPKEPNCGSVFKNVTVAEATRIGQEWLAAGWYIDQAGLKGFRIGGLQVYPGHANFIINDGTGTQSDFIQLLTHIRQAVFEQFGTMLEPEVECCNYEGVSYTWPKNTSTGNF